MENKGLRAASMIAAERLASVANVRINKSDRKTVQYKTEMCVMADLTELLKQAQAKYEAMTDKEKAEMLRLQKKSWVIGEMMFEHPDMSRDAAESLWRAAAIKMGIKP